MDNFLEQSDRREELIRRCLEVLDAHLSNETPTKNIDRLCSIDSIELNRVMRDTEATRRRTEKIRKAMAERAERAAPTYGRE